jgi:Fe-S cluster biogenesis protein NfuA
VLVNQKQDYGQFNVLGTYDFSGSATVVVVSETGNCSTCADAASFSSTGVEPEPEPEPLPDDQNQTIIIDDGDPGSFSNGKWKVSGGADPYGPQSLYSREAGAAYSYEASLKGSYEVALRWTYYKSRCEEVPVEIYDGDDLLDTVLVNQKQDYGQFNVLGTYDFSGSATVVVVSETGNCSTCADAVQFEK